MAYEAEHWVFKRRGDTRAVIDMEIVDNSQVRVRNCGLIFAFQIKSTVEILLAARLPACTSLPNSRSLARFPVSVPSSRA